MVRGPRGPVAHIEAQESVAAPVHPDHSRAPAEDEYRAPSGHRPRAKPSSERAAEPVVAGAALGAEMRSARLAERMRAPAKSIKEAQSRVAEADRELAQMNLSPSARRAIDLNTRAIALWERQAKLLKQEDSPRTREALGAIDKEIEAVKAEREALYDALAAEAPFGGDASKLRKTVQDRADAKADVETRAEDRLRALVEGRRVRRSVVLAPQIFDYLKENLDDFKDHRGNPLSDNDIRQISRMLAREVLAFSENPAKYRDGIRLDAQDGVYKFSDVDAAGSAKTIKLKLPFGMWIRPAPRGKGIEIELIGRRIGDGGLKYIAQSRPLTIDLGGVKARAEASEGAPIRYTHAMGLEKAVVVQAKMGSTEEVLEGLKVIRGNFSKQELAGMRLAGLTTLEERRHMDDLEARDVEYRGDLMGVESVLNPKQRLGALMDAFSDLEKFHAKGLVHGDVKGKNILISFEEPRGHLSDFDTAGQIRSVDGSQAHTPGHTDALFRRGIATPFTDIFASAVTSAQTLFGVKPDRLTLAVLEEHANPAIAEARDNGRPEEAAALVKCKLAIAEVLKQNQETLAFLDRSPDVLRGLGGTKQEKRGAMDGLYKEFPGFRNFFGEMRGALAGLA